MLTRAALASVLVFAAAACGSKNPGQDLCKQIPAPAACMTQCDPSPGAQSSCPSGYHCTPDGTCDAVCTPNGNQCGAGYICTMDGQCVGDGSGGPPPVDASCPSVHFSPTKTTPSIELLLDRSGSMGTPDINPTRYDALHTALTGAMGAITQAQGEAYFGAALFSGDETPCPPNATLDGKSVPRALNNLAAIDGLISANSPNGDTPTAEWITAVTADFAANPPPMGSPPIILLATDGEPNSCNDNTLNTPPSIAAAKAAYMQGVRLFIIGLATNGGALNPQFLQDMANAGTGVAAGQPNAPYYTANDPASLVSAFNTIINGVLSCDLTLSGSIDPSQAMSGQVTLNGMVLTYGTDWTLDPNGMVIHLIGNACNTLKSSPNPTVDAAFPCGAVIGRTAP